MFLHEATCPDAVAQDQGAVKTFSFRSGQAETIALLILALFNWASFQNLPFLKHRRSNSLLLTVLPNGDQGDKNLKAKFLKGLSFFTISKYLTKNKILKYRCADAVLIDVVGDVDAVEDVLQKFNGDLKLLVVERVLTETVHLGKFNFRKIDKVR